MFVKYAFLIPHLHLAPCEGAEVTTTLGAGAVRLGHRDLRKVVLVLDAGAETLQDGRRLHWGPARNEIVRANTEATTVFAG